MRSHAWIHAVRVRDPAAAVDVPGRGGRGQRRSDVRPVKGRGHEVYVFEGGAAERGLEGEEDEESGGVSREVD